MISRISKVARQLTVPPFSVFSTLVPSSHPRSHLGCLAAMASAAERPRRTIQTAACLIIGDEVLGGKVCIIAGYIRSYSVLS